MKFNQTILKFSLLELKEFAKKKEKYSLINLES